METETVTAVEIATEAPASAQPTTTDAPAKAQAAPKGTQVGNYLVFENKAGLNRLRAADGKLLPETFASVADARWYATRRTRLSAHVGFGGTKPLYMPKVPGNVGAYTIAGKLGASQVLAPDGTPIGPEWKHPTNSAVDAMRYAERLVRGGN